MLMLGWSFFVGAGIDDFTSLPEVSWMLGDFGAHVGADRAAHASGCCFPFHMGGLVTSND